MMRRVFGRTSRPFSAQARQSKVVLDGNTVYIERELAESLGWSQQTGPSGVPLALGGWGPTFFAIAPTNSDSDLLARATVESSRNPTVQGVLEHLKKSDEGER